ncbi:hypothetical protein [Rufibacter roseolus]|uniref:hypothetical protein n=1 Tax=Rufibacter roseolus TaxID=2817375 RepID=UPI001B3069A3|nr:hypothetical protein [Rufibacter roseolus]
MKAFTYLFLLFFLGALNQTLAQDIIFKTSGEEIKAKVLEITPDKVQYTQPAKFADSLFTLARKEVFMVKYANGKNELMHPPVEEKGTTPVLSSQDMYRQGQMDARQYYRGTNAVLGSIGATLLLGIPGTVLIAAIPPKVNPKEVPNPALLSDQYYYNGYRHQAHKRKVGKAAIGGGIALAAFVAILASMPSRQ